MTIKRMDHVAAACEFARVSSRPAAGIEDLRSGQNPPANKPGDDHAALLLDRAVNQQIECPSVFSVERTANRLVHFGPTGQDDNVPQGHG